MPTRAIFYDAGGTLVRQDVKLADIYALVRARYPDAPDLEAVARALPDPVYFFYVYPLNDPTVPWQVHSDEAFRASAAEYYAHAFKQAGLVADDQELQSVLREAHDHHWSPQVWDVFPDVVAALEEGKRRGLVQGVISDAASAMAGVLDHLGISRYLDFVIISALTGLSKPDATIFELALRQAQVPAEEALYIGDNYLPDVLGARSAGIPVLLIDRHGPRSRRPPVVDVPVIENLGDLWRYVRS
jgi:HAD superfamily hydrolase (TIGR01549 family)